LVTSAPTLKLLQDHYNVSEDDLVNDFKLNDVYMQGAVSFYGTNIMERRVLESWMIQALGEKREVQCKHYEDGRGHYRGCYTCGVSLVVPVGTASEGIEAETVGSLQLLKSGLSRRL
jgi:hypothetical protein